MKNSEINMAIVHCPHCQSVLKVTIQDPYSAFPPSINDKIVILEELKAQTIREGDMYVY